MRASQGTSMSWRSVRDSRVHEIKLIRQYKLEFIPVEDDLLSLELEDVARDVFLVRPPMLPYLSSPV